MGVRELRQNLSVYLDRIKDGESLDVTERGHVVARMVPSRGEEDSIFDRMVEDGRISLGAGSLASLDPPPVDRSGPPLSQVLADLRDGEAR